MMYLDFFGLKEKPFTLSPNPKFLYYSPNHKEAISQFIFAVYEQSGFMALTGEVGTGKTMLINALIMSLPKNYIIVNINHKVLSTKGLIQNICKELSIDFSNKTTTELFIILREHLKTTYSVGKKTILILDEAQNLSQAILEDVRLLSNFEAMHEKYLQILIVGQPELDKKLKDINLRQLKERISLRYYLTSLNRKETGNYVRHRLKVAGYRREKKLFTEDAVDYMYEQTEGIPRRINILCDNALLMGYTINSQEIGVSIIKKVNSTEFTSELDIVSTDYSDAKREIGFNDLTQNRVTDLVSSEDSDKINDSNSQDQAQNLASDSSLQSMNIDINDPISQNQDQEFGNSEAFEEKNPEANDSLPQSQPHELKKDTMPESKNLDINHPVSQNQNHQSGNNAPFENNNPKVNDAHDNINTNITDPVPHQYRESLNGAKFENRTHPLTEPTAQPEKNSVQDPHLEKLIDVILDNVIIVQKPSIPQVLIGTVLLFSLFFLAFFLAFSLIGIF